MYILMIFSAPDSQSVQPAIPVSQNQSQFRNHDSQQPPQKSDTQPPPQKLDTQPPQQQWNHTGQPTIQTLPEKQSVNKQIPQTQQATTNIPTSSETASLSVQQANNQASTSLPSQPSQVPQTSNLPNPDSEGKF